MYIHAKRLGFVTILLWVSIVACGESQSTDAQADIREDIRRPSDDTSAADTASDITMFDQGDVTPSDDSITDGGDTNTAPDLVLPTSPGTHSIQTMHDNKSRTLVVVVPDGYDPSGRNPMLLVFHGAGQQADTFAQKRHQLRAAAAERKWLLVFPEAYENSYGKRSWGWKDPTLVEEWPDGIDDIGFAVAIMDAAMAQLGADPSSVFVGGFSNGGRMAQQMAAHHPDRLAGMAITSTTFTSAVAGDATQVASTTSPQDPIPALLAHGRADTSVPYDGEPATNAFPELVERWRGANQCGAQAPSTENRMGGVRVDNYVDCEQIVRAASVRDLGHEWTDSDATGWNMSNETVLFMEEILGTR